MKFKKSLLILVFCLFVNKVNANEFWDHFKEIYGKKVPYYQLDKESGKKYLNSFFDSMWEGDLKSTEKKLD